MASTYVPPHRLTQLTNEIYRTVKQNFVLPEIPGYEPSRVWKRKGCELVLERPESYWRTHYLRRGDNANRGFNSVSSEPYKCMGGDVVLDTCDLVYDHLECIDKANVAESRKEAEVKHEVYNPIIKTDGDEFDENKNRRGSGRAGYGKILDSLQTTAERRAAVKAGLPYEEHLRIVESQLADLDVKPVESMILMSTSDLVLQLGFNRGAIDLASPDNRSSIDGTRSPQSQRVKSGNTNSRVSTATHITRASISEESNSSFLCNTGTERLDRLRRDNVAYLKCILEVIVILHNIKSKLLKSKVPLPAPLMRSLKRTDYGVNQKCKSIKFNRYNSKKQSTETLLSTEYSNLLLSDIKGSLDSPSGIPKRISGSPTSFGLFSGRRFSRVPAMEEFKMETWEDLLYLDNREKLNTNQVEASKKLDITSDMASRTLRWSKLAKDTEDKSKNPVWQVILTEKTSGESFIDRKTKSTDVALVPQRSRTEWESVKAKLQRYCISDVDQLNRQTMQYFRFKMNSFDDLKSNSLFEKHCGRMRDTSGLIPVAAANNEIMEALEVAPSKWYEELQIKIYNVLGPEESEINTALLKLGKYSQMGVRSVPHCRAKLCLVVLSMPAYDLCKIPMQMALRFVLVSILNGQADEFYYWLHLRKIPNVLVK